MDDVLREASRLGSAGAPAALATVIRASGSTPRRPGAKMLVLADGATVGTIGGGRIELEITELARAVARGERPGERVTRHLTHELAMCCGGEMEILVEPLDGRWKALAEAARRRARRMPCGLSTALDGSGKDVLRAPPPEARVDGDRFVEPVLPPPRLVIYGGGHVARAVAPLAARLGFELVVCDDDERWATPERFPDAAAIVPGFDADAAQAGDWVLILTRDHAVDEELVRRLLPRTELAYLGLIGSRGKVGRFRKRLAARGLDDEALWARLHAPVGLDIGAETPEEIAVAIAAELVQCARRR